MSNKRKLLYITGITPDGKPILSGLLKVKETWGLPLESIFDKFIENDCVVNWGNFIQEAKNMGVNRNRFLSELRVAILDSFGADYLEKVWDLIQMKWRINDG